MDKDLILICIYGIEKKKIFFVYREKNFPISQRKRFCFYFSVSQKFNCE